MYVGDSGHGWHSKHLVLTRVCPYTVYVCVCLSVCIYVIVGDSGHSWHSKHLVLTL